VEEERERERVSCWGKEFKKKRKREREQKNNILSSRKKQQKTRNKDDDFTSSSYLELSTASLSLRLLLLRASSSSLERKSSLWCEMLNERDKEREKKAFRVYLVQKRLVQKKRKTHKTTRTSRWPTLKLNRWLNSPRYYCYNNDAFFWDFLLFCCAFVFSLFSLVLWRRGGDFDEMMIVFFSLVIIIIIIGMKDSRTYSSSVSSSSLMMTITIIRNLTGFPEKRRRHCGWFQRKRRRQSVQRGR